MSAFSCRICRRSLMRHALLLVITLAFAPIQPLPSAAAATPPAEVTPAAVPTPHPYAGVTAWIAYYSGDGIGLIHPDGTGDHQLALDLHDEQLLAEWPPDGTRLVFTVRRGDRAALTVTSARIQAGDETPHHEGKRAPIRTAATVARAATYGRDRPSRSHVRRSRPAARLWLRGFATRFKQNNKSFGPGCA